MNTLIKYIRDSREELAKVSWPSREQTTNSTVLVVAVSVAFALFLGAADYGLSKLLEFLLAIF